MSLSARLLTFALIVLPALPLAAQSRYVGVAGCAAANCHSGESKSGSPRGAEYNVWILQDPHAKAYSVLFTTRSQLIAQRLWADEKNPQAHKKAECLACHSLDSAPEHVVPGRKDLVDGGGVSCEACHGPSEKWLDTHYRPGYFKVDARWETSGKPEDFVARFKDREEIQQKKDGPLNLFNLKTRGEQCVRCHIGPSFGYDMNHDFIGAGHPRLTFEYSTFMASLPVHWNVEAEKKAQPFFEARLWALGRAISAEAGLKLLAQRVRHDGKLNGVTPPWPEFSEYDCYACHHAVGGVEFTGFGRGKGRLRWGTWNTALLPEVKPGEALTLPMVNPLAGLQASMNASGNGDRSGIEAVILPGREKEFKVPPAITQAATLLNNDPANDPKTFTAESVKGLTLKIATEAAANRTPSWDAWTQHYLAVQALHNSLVTTLGAENVGVDVTAVDETLVGLKKLLWFPKGYESPRSVDHKAIMAEFEKLQKLYETK